MRIAVGDLETDPFEYGSIVRPFVAGFYDGSTFDHIWSDDCIPLSLRYLESIKEPTVFYFHNGGKFILTSSFGTSIQSRLSTDALYKLESGHFVGEFVWPLGSKFSGEISSGQI